MSIETSTRAEKWTKLLQPAKLPYGATYPSERGLWYSRYRKSQDSLSEKSYLRNLELQSTI